MTAGLAALLAGGAAAGAGLLAGIGGGLMEGALAFGSAALLYLVTEGLLVEAHAIEETLTPTAAFFAGFLALLLIEMLT